MNEQFYQEVIETLKRVGDLTSRIDERVKILIENDEDAREKIEKLFDNQTNMLTRLIVLENKNGMKLMDELKVDVRQINVNIDNVENRLLLVERDINHYGNKWKSIFDFIFKVAITVIGGIILWKLGIHP
jgi:hypothetical protein